jgi:hypothetical protein
MAYARVNWDEVTTPISAANLNVMDKGIKDLDDDALELGETSATAYRGDRGKTAYDHTALVSATNDPHGLGSDTLKAASGAVASGTNAVALGHDALADGNNTVAIGNAADAGGITGVAVGRIANASGAWSTAIGSNAAASAESSIAIGISSAASGVQAVAVGGNTIANKTNSMALGYGAAAQSNDTIRIGNTSVASIGGQVGWTTVSDERDKKDIQECEHGLDFINKVKPAKFKMDPRGRYDNKKPDGSKADKNYSYGFVAQDLLKVQKGTDLHIVNETDPDNLGVTAESLIPSLVRAIQDLSKEVEELKKLK